MNIILADSAGFCFGVKRAIEKTYETLKDSNQKVYSIGPLIHNEIVTGDLKNKGLIEVNDELTIKSLKNKLVIIRTHGTLKKIEDILDLM